MVFTAGSQLVSAWVDDVPAGGRCLAQPAGQTIRIIYPFAPGWFWRCSGAVAG